MRLDAIVIDQIRPATPGGSGRPVSSTGESTPIGARIFRDGHDLLAGRVRWRRRGSRSWHEAPLADVGEDRWETTITPTQIGLHHVVIEAWTDRFATWRKEVRLKVGAGVDVTLELEEGARILEDLLPEVAAAHRDRVSGAIEAIRRDSCTMDVRLNAALDDAIVPAIAGIPSGTDRTTSAPVELWVDRERARQSSWYEFFPRSEGGFRGSLDRLDEIAAMGFDIVYLPPIHPIGTTARKGPNNTLHAGPGDVGSPWAIGGPDGGHTAIHPELGDEDDFAAFVDRARSLGMEIALDYALQCSPDHPWVHDHPEWFHVRPDGTIRHAENPPKKYQDIHPINFWPTEEADRIALWEACRDVLVHWIERGVDVFRVDNPHTKPLAFWQWCIAEIRAAHPQVLFLAEAFTRPAMMAKLAEVGFTQSYTYFTWRHTKAELTSYVEELAHGPLAEVMRPNFWPNTPDILGGILRGGTRAAFLQRWLLAATLVPNHGLYSGYELCENVPASDQNEEYLSSEKYEIKRRDWTRTDSIAPFITRVNEIGRAHPALGRLRGIVFHHVDNDHLIAYTRGSRSEGDLVLVVVNLDPDHVQEGTVHLDLGAVGCDDGRPLRLRDELDGETYEWSGAADYVRLDPLADQVGHVFDIAP